MKTRIASLFLLLVLFGGALAGVPLPAGQSDCGMHGMMDMDCCAAALLKELTPEVADAKLCCVLSCAQNGTTSPPSGTRVDPPAPGHTTSQPPAARALPLRWPEFRASDRWHEPPGSPPTYLRNLTLLI